MDWSNIVEHLRVISSKTEMDSRFPLVDVRVPSCGGFERNVRAKAELAYL
jgi:hypothetical protein